MPSKVLVLFDTHYPYGQGSEFLSDEMRVAENIFDKIVIVSAAKPPLVMTKYLPQNATVIPIREKSSKKSLFLNRTKYMFYPSTWIETARGITERGLSNFKSIFFKVILEKSMLAFLKKSESGWINEKACFYSYWLDTFPTYMTANKKRLRGILISRAHGGDCFYNRGYHPNRHKQFEGLDHIYSISDIGTQDLIAQGCPPEKVSTARLGIIKHSEKMNPYSCSTIKRIVSCSNIIPLKRLDMLIDALALIDDIQIEWIHFGDGELKQEMENRAREKLSGKGNIDYAFKGYVPKEKILEFYENETIDLFINCSDTEGIPVSVMEAMAYGIPALARDVGGNREIVETECNGILLPTNCTAKILSDTICHVLKKPDSSYMVLREGAFKTYETKYNAKVNYTAFWNDILKNPV